MRNTLIVGAVLATLTACGGAKAQPKPQSSPSPNAITTYVPNSPAPGGPEEAAFVQALRKEFPALPDESARAAIVTGHMTCAELDSGTTVREINLQLVKRQVDPHWVGAIVGYSIGAFCPRHLHLLSP